MKTWKRVFFQQKKSFKKKPSKLNRKRNKTGKNLAKIRPNCPVWSPTELISSHFFFAHKLSSPGQPTVIASQRNLSQYFRVARNRTNEFKTNVRISNSANRTNVRIVAIRGGAVWKACDACVLASLSLSFSLSKHEAHICIQTNNIFIWHAQTVMFQIAYTARLMCAFILSERYTGVQHVNQWTIKSLFRNIVSVVVCVGNQNQIWAVAEHSQVLIINIFTRGALVPLFKLT